MLHPWLHKDWEKIKAGNLKTCQPLLITGAEGRGQWDLAQCAAKAFLSVPSDKPFDPLSYPDLWFLADEDGDTISIDTARLLGEHTVQKPMRPDGCRVVLIEHFDRATTAAQQSLLKVFEEPFVKTAFVLTATHADRVIPTIRSRMSTLNVPPVSRDQYRQWCKDNHIDYQDWHYDFTDGSPLLLKKYDVNKLAEFKAAIEEHAPNMFALSKAFDRSILYALMYHHLAKRAQASLDMKDFEKLDQWQALYQEAGMSKSMNWELNVGAF